MALRGSAFVIMWHDIAPDGDAAYNLWHTREHMPERIALPGFHRSRRGINRDLPRQHYFTLYECADLGSTVSPEYQRSLNSPTAWTTEVAPAFRNFKRMACETAVSRSRGVGGSIATFRATLPAGTGEAAATAALGPAIDAILDLPAVTGAHVGFARPDHGSGTTTEVRLRQPMTEPDFAVVVVVEGIDLPALAASEDAIATLLAGNGLPEVTAQSYDVAYMLDIESAR